MKIPIKGVIVANDEKMIYEMFGYEVTTPKDVEEMLEEAEEGEDLDVIINSPGGDVFSGSEIYTELMDYNGPVNIKIAGVAASAASIVAMAGGTVKISPTAEMMIHNVTEVAQGDYRYFEHEAEVLKNYNKTMANAYKLKTGMEHEELLDLMGKETWLTPQKAKEYGFVDEIMFDEGNKLAASAAMGSNMLLPPEVINKVRENFANNTDDNNNGGNDNGGNDNDNDRDDGGDKKGNELEIQKARLNLLKLRRVN